MSRLSPIDASFLQLQSPHAHMNVGWSAFGTVPIGGQRPTIEALRARVASRLRYVPRCRQRLQFHPLGLGEPHWVDDPAFDLDAHITALGEPDEPLSIGRFEELRDALLSAPLDRTRPLWQIALAPRLQDGRVAVVGRVHHALADGAGALLIAALGLDTDREDAAPSEPWQARPAPAIARRTIDPLLHRAEITARAVGAAVRAAQRPGASTVAALRDAHRVVGALREDLLPRAPRSPLNLTLGARRTLIGHRVLLDELRGAGDGTLNDIGLTVVAGALRTLALERGHPPQPLKALVPVDVRRSDEREALGNHVSLAAVWLPLHLSAPEARLAHVKAATDRFKRSRRPAGAHTLLTGLGLLPYGLRGAMLRAAVPGSFNLSVSSIPGPRTPVYMLGARLDEVYPVVPIAEGQALSIGMLRYDRHLHFGLHADPAALPDAVRLPGLLADEVRALRDACGTRRAHPAVRARAAPPILTPS